MNCAQSVHSLIAFLLLVLFAGSAPCKAIAEGDKLYAQELLDTPFHIVVPVILDGTQISMIFDTGAAISGLDTNLAQMLKGAGQEVGLSDANGIKIEAQTGFIDHMKLGDLSYHRQKIAITSLAPLRLYTGHQIQGVFGMSSLHIDCITLNYDRKKFILSDVLPEMKGYQQIPISLLSPCPYINFQLNGIQIPCLIDTGSTGAISISHESFDEAVKAGIIEERNISGRTASAGGVLKNRSGRFQGGEFMSRPLKGIDVNSRDKKYASIGLDWLVAFNTIFDLKNSKLYYQIRNVPPHVDCQFTLGVIFSFNEGLVKVERLLPGGMGAAEKAGLKVGDAILQFGPLSSKQMNVTSIYETVVAAHDKTIPCRIKDAKTLEERDIKITFDDFVFLTSEN